MKRQRRSDSLRIAPAILAGLIISAVACQAGQKVSDDAAKPKGLWLLPRKDPGNTARADCPGNMKSAPRVVWSYGHDSKSYSFVRPVRIGADTAYLVRHLNGIQAVLPNGHILWEQPAMGASDVVDLLATARTDAPVILVTLGQYGLAMLDAVDGKMLWSWAAPAAPASSPSRWRP